MNRPNPKQSNTMDKAKAERTKKNTIVQRRMKELSNAVKSELHASDVEKKLQTLVDAMEELGGAHDKVSSLLPDGDDGSAEDKWYFGIDCEVNKEIKKARQHRQCIHRRQDVRCRAIQAEKDRGSNLQQ